MENVLNYKYSKINNILENVPSIDLWIIVICIDNFISVEFVEFHKNALLIYFMLKLKFRYEKCPNFISNRKYYKLTLTKPLLFCWLAVYVFDTNFWLMHTLTHLIWFKFFLFFLFFRYVRNLFMAVFILLSIVIFT